MQATLRALAKQTTNLTTVLKITLSPYLENFLTRLEQQPNRFRSVVFIAPFLEFRGGKSQQRWLRLLTRLEQTGVEMALVTRPLGTATHLQNIAIFDTVHPSRPTLFLPELHAKLYVAVGREKRASVCLLTSANLSDAALVANIEATMFLEPPFIDFEFAYLDKFMQLADLVVRRARAHRKHSH